MRYEDCCNHPADVKPLPLPVLRACRDLVE